MEGRVLWMQIFGEANSEMLFSVSSNECKGVPIIIILYYYTAGRFNVGHPEWAAPHPSRRFILEQ
jgi:hypothetical protein